MTVDEKIAFQLMVAAYCDYVDAHNAAETPEVRSQASAKAHAIVDLVRAQFGDVQAGVLVMEGDMHVGLDQEQPMCGGMFLERNDVNDDCATGRISRPDVISGVDQG